MCTLAPASVLKCADVTRQQPLKLGQNTAETPTQMGISDQLLNMIPVFHTQEVTEREYL